ncbi:hypothetical protein LX32DRAFT_448443 [Colletotrichum zoysiae]|uniref:Uncharacterized protein n=1 Tax=Colletotrichum zoysiae TaxID=1216348 RepID=A0AAD9HEA6_9PEZI|nr:hypothetical protein LX32DRAFT_448443 [Colletotrichum zoysiae]
MRRVVCLPACLPACLRGTNTWAVPPYARSGGRGRWQRQPPARCLMTIATVIDPEDGTGEIPMSVTHRAGADGHVGCDVRTKLHQVSGLLGWRYSRLRCLKVYSTARYRYIHGRYQGPWDGLNRGAIERGMGGLQRINLRLDSTGALLGT